MLSAHVPPSVDGRFCFVYVKQTAFSSPHIRHVLHIRVVINKQLQTAGSLLHWRDMHSQIQRQGVVEEMIEVGIVAKVVKSLFTEGSFSSVVQAVRSR